MKKAIEKDLVVVLLLLLHNYFRHQAPSEFSQMRALNRLHRKSREIEELALWEAAERNGSFTVTRCWIFSFLLRFRRRGDPGAANEFNQSINHSITQSYLLSWFPFSNRKEGLAGSEGSGRNAVHPHDGTLQPLLYFRSTKAPLQFTPSTRSLVWYGMVW